MALLPEEPAGRISIRTAGAVFFEATLEQRPGGETPPGPVLGEPAPGARFYSLVQSEAPTPATALISCEIRALCATVLADALNNTLRSVMNHAALTEAVLETRAVRVVDPRIPPGTLVQTLARQLWESGFPVSFGPSWTPAPEADISVGVQGLRTAFEAFLRGHPAWRTLD